MPTLTDLIIVATDADLVSEHQEPTLGFLLTQLRADLDDVLAGTNSDGYFSRPALVDWINRAKSDTEMRARCHRTRLPITPIYGTHTYSAKPQFEVLEVDLDYDLNFVDMANAAVAARAWDFIAAGAPTDWVPITGSSFRVSPTPLSGALSMIATVEEMPLNAGTGYAVGDILEVRGGGGGGLLKVRELYTGGKNGMVFGDANARGYAATKRAYEFIHRIEEATGWALTNAAENSAFMVNMARTAFAVEVAEDQNYVLLDGFNDMRHYGSDADGIGTYEASLRAILAWLGIPHTLKTFASDADVVKVGIWAEELLYGGNVASQYSTSLGDTLTATISRGNTVYIGYTCRPADGGTFTVTINDLLVATIDTAAGHDASATAAVSWPQVVRADGLQDIDDHEVVIEVTSAGGKRVQIEWFACNSDFPLATSPRLFAGNTLRLNATGYAYIGPYDLNQGSDADVAAFNVIHAAVVAELVADGINIAEVDVCAVYDPTTADVGPTDNLHPNDQGHEKIADAFIAEIEAFPSIPLLELATNDRASRGTGYTAGDGKPTRATGGGVGSGCTVNITIPTVFVSHGYATSDALVLDTDAVTSIPAGLAVPSILSRAKALALAARPRLPGAAALASAFNEEWGGGARDDKGRPVLTGWCAEIARSVQGGKRG